MSYPNYFPQYIADIVDPYEKIVWQRKYSETYAEEYSKVNSEWYGLKATMIGVTMLAITLFATIMTATRLEKGAFAVASTLVIGTVGTTAAICTMVYYGWKGDENSQALRNFGSSFPLRFEILFNEAMLQQNKQAAQEPQAPEDDTITSDP